MTVRLSFPDCTVEESRVRGELFHTIDLPGFAHACRPGEPAVPVGVYYLAVPEGARVSVGVMEHEVVKREGIRISPAPRPVYVPEESRIEAEFCIDRALYAADRLYPQSTLEIGSYGYIRDLRVVQIRVYPVQFNLRRREAYICRRMLVRVELTGGVFPPRREMDREDGRAADPFEALYRNVILNYHEGFRGSGGRGDYTPPGGACRPAESIRQGWTSPPRDPAGDAAGLCEYLGGASYKVWIEEDGIYGIGYQDLADAGAGPGGIDPRTLRLFHGASEVALFVSGEDDGRFDPGDRIVFFGLGNTSEYSRRNAYWLSWGSQRGLRMEKAACSPGDSFPVPSAFRERLRFEKDLLYSPSLYQGEGKDHWFWSQIDTQLTVEYALLVPDVASVTQDVVFTANLRGRTDLPHHTELWINRYLGDAFTWDGRIEYFSHFTLPQRYIGHDDNLLVVKRLGGELDQIYFNWLEIEYRREFKARDGVLRFTDPREGPDQFEVTSFPGERVDLYRITDPLQPVRMTDFDVLSEGGTYTLVFEDTLSGGEYYALDDGAVRKPAGIERDEPSHLRSPANRADYIVVADRLFSDAVQELVQYRRSEGLDVLVAAVDDVYDEFNGGNADPAAIREFVSYAYHNWRQPAPVYLLLVGDASYDYRGNLPKGNRNFVPTHLFTSEMEWGETSSDDWFVCVSGDDMLPDLLVGRITAQVAGDVTAAVEKIIDYETNHDPAPWREKILLVCDDKDDAGDFCEICRQLRSYTIAPTGYDAGMICREECFPLQCRQEIIDSINAGCVICNYVGHGSIDRWAHETIFTSLDVPLLDNADRYPLFVTCTCLNGCFHHATDDYCLAEELARARLHGGIACWSFSGTSYVAYSATLAEYLFGALLGEGNFILGSAACEAKIRYLGLPGIAWDHAMMLILFGDPALEIALPGRPDLRVGGVAFHPRYPGAGAPDTVEASVFNAGRLDAADFSVRFTHGHPDSGSSVLIGEVTVPALAAGSMAKAAAVWSAVPAEGSYPVYVTVDPEGSVLESCEWNNTDWDTLVVLPPCAPGDTVPPVIALFVDGGSVGDGFTSGDFTSSSPEIEAVIEDSTSGVNIGEVTVVLNGLAVEDFEMEHDGVGSSRVTVRYRPASLPDGAYALCVGAADCGCGPNRAAASVSFAVQSALALRGVRSFPNPCREGARFGYTLSQPADEVTIAIYAVTGALIRTVRCTPGARNCNEFTWDGRDRHGNLLASGVYFYRLTARGASGRDEAKGKFVVVR